VAATPGRRPAGSPSRSIATSLVSRTRRQAARPAPGRAAGQRPAAPRAPARPRAAKVPARRARGAARPAPPPGGGAMAIASFYWVAFAAFAAPAAWLEFDHGSGLFGGGKGAAARGERAGPEYARFRNNYLIVFALMMGGSVLRQWPPHGGARVRTWGRGGAHGGRIAQASAPPPAASPAPSAHPHPDLRPISIQTRPRQPATGCRAPTSTTSTSTTASASATSGGYLSWASPAAPCLGPSPARWRTSSERAPGGRGSGGGGGLLLRQQLVSWSGCRPAHPALLLRPPPLHSGRKRASLLYVATYSLSCATKHSPSYSVLLVGRLLGGVSTSLLFSVFEAWAVAAHTGRGFDESLLVRWGGGLGGAWSCGLRAHLQGQQRTCKAGMAGLKPVGASTAVQRAP
jgi:hypothetical protein